LQDAWSTKYKSALHSGAFQKAVKTYRQRSKQQDPLFSAHSSPAPQPSSTTNSASTVRASNERAQKHLEALPVQILRHAKAFYRHVQYFVHHSASGTEYREGKENEPTMPIDLKVMLDEIAHAQHLEERVKNELLQDEEARNTLFMLSFEKALREMVDIAEHSLSAMAERDRLQARGKHRNGEGSKPGTSFVTQQPSKEQSPIPPNTE
jgi:potassium channel subfamily K